MKTYFITGISTAVGKTIVAAIITEALQADYWKPIQAGDLEHSDSDTVKGLISNSKTILHPNSFALKNALSPHAAAELEGVTISASAITQPKTKNHLVIEGAGGLLVPINAAETILDIIHPSHTVIVVSRHYLGSINHTLLTLNLLKQKGYEVKLIFNGDANPATENIITTMTQVPVIGRIDTEPYFDKNVILEYANRFKPLL